MWARRVFAFAFSDSFHLSNPLNALQTPFARVCTSRVHVRCHVLLPIRIYLIPTYVHSSLFSIFYHVLTKINSKIVSLQGVFNCQVVQIYYSATEFSLLTLKL